MTKELTGWHGKRGAGIVDNDGFGSNPNRNFSAWGALKGGAKLLVELDLELFVVDSSGGVRKIKIECNLAFFG